MNIISYIINFKKNFNTSHCTHLLSRMSKAIEKPPAHIRIDEHTAAACTGENQPPLSKICEGYQFSIVFDGELSDSAELKKELQQLGYSFLTHTDAELALNCYIHFGIHCPEKLNGCYSFIIHDSMRRQVFAVTDFFASKPLFYCTIKNVTLISSKIHALLSHPEIKAKISHEALQELLSVPSHCTGNIFDGIYRLPPSHYLIVKKENISIGKYQIHSMQKASEDIIPISFNSETLYSYEALKSRTHNLAQPYPLWNSAISNKEFKNGLKSSVYAHALPLLSDNDFLIPNALKNADKGIIFSSHPFCGTTTAHSCFANVLIKNNAYHKAVYNTLNFENRITFPHSFLSTAPILCADFGFDLKMPYLTQEVYEQSTFLPYNPRKQFNIKSEADSVEYNNAQKKISHYASRELLKVISNDESPINAFFDRSAILRLCEGKFDFSESDISALTLITYILKLNIWFLTYRPMLI